MSLYNIIQKQTNKYIPLYILPEPSILYLYSSKPIIKSIQKNQLDEKNYVNSLTTDDNNNDTNYEIIYIRVRRSEANTNLEWNKFIKKN